EPLDDLDALRAALKPLVDRKLVVYLTSEDRRGAVVTHGFHDPRELERLKEKFAAMPASVVEPDSPQGVYRSPDPSEDMNRIEDRLRPLEEGLRSANTEIASLKKLISDLQASMAAIQQEVRHLKQELGG